MHDDLRCTGVAATIDEALALAAATPPDVVLMDLDLPGIDGIQGTRSLRIAHPGARVLVLTGTSAADALIAAAEAGAERFLTKELPLTELLAAIRGAEGGLPLDRRIVRSISPGIARHTDVDTLRQRARAHHLTPREHGILIGLAGGTDVKGIATELGITVATCRTYMRSIREKLGVHSQLAAVVAASRAGLLPKPASPSDWGVTPSASPP